MLDDDNSNTKLRAIELIYKLSGVIKDEKVSLNVNNQNQVLMFPSESYLCNTYLKEIDKQGRLMELVNQDEDYVYLKNIVNSLIYYNREATVECQSEQIQEYLKQSRQVLNKLKDTLSKVK